MNEARVYRGTLVSRVKGVMFDVFRTSIQKISSSSPSNIIREWKICDETRWCLQNLTNPIDQDDDDEFTYLNAIVNKVWKNNKELDNVKFAHAICHLVLGEDHDGITISEDSIKHKMRALYVSNL
jgi:hypothetical protein